MLLGSSYIYTPVCHAHNFLERHWRATDTILTCLTTIQKCFSFTLQNERTIYGNLSHTPTLRRAASSLTSTEKMALTVTAVYRGLYLTPTSLQLARSLMVALQSHLKHSVMNSSERSTSVNIHTCMHAQSLQMAERMSNVLLHADSFCMKTACCSPV